MGDAGIESGKVLFPEVGDVADVFAVFPGIDQTANQGAVGFRFSDRKARRKPLALAMGSSRDRCENAVTQ